MSYCGRVNRVEVIDHTKNGKGRVLSKWEDFRFDVVMDFQDGGRTLKIFLSEDFLSEEIPTDQMARK